MTDLKSQDRLDRQFDKVKLSSFQPEDEMSIYELISLLWKNKWKLIGAGFGGALIAAVFSIILMQNVFQSSVLLSEVSTAEGGFSSALQQYSGLANLAGVSLGSGEGITRGELALAVLESREFIGGFIERHELLVPLMASSKWNPETGELEIDPRLYNESENVWVRDVALPKSPKPSMLEAHERFIELMNVTKEAETGLVTLSIEFLSPTHATEWAALIVADLNQTIRDRDISEAERSITYLQQQIELTAVTQLDAVLYDLIRAQTETMMLAQTRPEYAFRVIDPPVLPELKSGPNRALITFVGGVIGGFLGLSWIFIAHVLSAFRVDSHGEDSK